MDRLLRNQVAVLVGLVICYITHVRLLDGRVQDDAYITFRYARHLAEGSGLVWNLGERVEGYTNFLWTLLISAGFMISSKISPMQIARAVSSFAGYATVVSTFMVLRHLLPRSKMLPLVAPALIVGSWAFAINTMTGLETIFFASLVTIATSLLVVEQDDFRFRGSSFVFAAAALTRPEAIGLFLLLFGLVVWEHRRSGLEARNYLLRLGAAFSAIVGSHEVFRIVYYGQLVPNTFFAKFGVELPQGMPTRSSYFLDFFKKGMDPLGLSAVFVLVFIVAKWREHRSRLLMAAGLYGFLFVGLSGADFMIGFRYLVPFLPILYVCSTLGCHFLIRKLKKKGRPLEVVALGLSGLAIFFEYSYSQNTLRPFEQLRYRVTADSCTTLGEWMAKSLPADTVVVARDIGEIGYLSDLPMVDMTGLTDAEIARKPGDLLDRELNLDYIFNRNPGAFVFVSRLPGPVEGPRRFMAYSSTRATTALLSDPRMEQFQFFARYPSYSRLRKADDGTWHPASDANRTDTSNTYYLELYLRKDLAQNVPR